MKGNHGCPFTVGTGKCFSLEKKNRRQMGGISSCELAGTTGGIFKRSL